MCPFSGATFYSSKADVLEILTSVGANLINLAGLDNLKTAVSVILIVTRSAQRRANAGVNVRVIAKQALLGSVVEVCAVVDTRYL